MRRSVRWIALSIACGIVFAGAQLKLGAKGAPNEGGRLKSAATDAEPQPAIARYGVQREPPVPKELMERAGAWADKFLGEFGNYAAEETLEQIRWEGKRRAEVRRQIVSDYIVVRLPETPRELQEFRDVVRVDDKEKLSETTRTAKWAKLTAAKSRADIVALVEDPQRDRLFPEHFSNLGLLVSRLATRHQDKMKYFFAQDTSEGSSRHALVGYRQVSGEGLMDVDGKPVYPSGQAWIEPDDGHIVRIEEEFVHDKTRYSVAVDYGLSDELNAWVVQGITVRIFDKGRLEMQNIYGYANFRRFGVAGETASPQSSNPQVKP